MRNGPRPTMDVAGGSPAGTFFSVCVDAVPYSLAVPAHEVRA